VEGFPTLKFFPKDDKSGQPYSGDRSLGELVRFINEKSGKSRLPNGRPNEKAGRDTEFDKLAATLLSSESAQHVVDAAKKLAKTSAAKTAELYAKLFEKIAKSGREYVQTEIARLGRLLDGDVTATKRDEFVIRSNILNAFIEVSKEEEHPKDEPAEIEEEHKE